MKTQQRKKKTTLTTVLLLRKRYNRKLELVVLCSLWWLWYLFALRTFSDNTITERLTCVHRKTVYIKYGLGLHAKNIGIVRVVYL